MLENTLRVCLGVGIAALACGDAGSSDDDDSSADGNGSERGSSGGSGSSSGSPDDSGTTSDTGDESTDTTSGGPVETECPEPSGEGTVHDTFLIEADEVWTFEDSPHYVPESIAIRGATVTIESCAYVILGEDASIEVGDVTGDPAVLRAEGEFDGETLLPVVFAPEADDVYFGSLWVDTTGTLELVNTIVVGGGSVNTGTTNGAIVAVGGLGFPVLEAVHLVNVGVVNSAGFAIQLRDFTAFSPTSDNVVIESAGLEAAVDPLASRYPMYVTTAALGSIPRGTYTGNAIDAILVDASDRYPQDVTLRARGVPYVSNGDFHVEPDDTGLITLTVEAGVTLAFPPTTGGAYRLFLGSSAAPDNAELLRPVRLLAEGTEAEPIVFTSAAESPTAGDWAGIDWGGGPSTGNVFDYVTIDYAGGPNGTNGFGCGPGDNVAALIVTDWRPDDAFITNSTFSRSAGGGIVSGWDSPNEGPDLTGNNTFSDLAVACAVSQPSVDGACPGNDDQPDCY